MYSIIKKFINHGVVTVDYPKKPVNSKSITGKPEIDMGRCDACGECVKRCPSSALQLETDKNKTKKVTENNAISTLSLNLDECIFCSLCSDVCNKNAITMTNNFELAEYDRESLRKTPVVVKDRDLPSDEYELIGQQLKENINRYFGRSLQIREVDAGSCNGCDNEINALNGPYNDIERFGISFVASPRHADMLLVTGPASRNMELALIKTYNATPDPKLVVAVGACACSGGIFKDSYATRNGIDCIVPVDIYIPGCPPRPQAIIYGLLKAIERK
ncbi:MAG: NADH-quinone oxidoreductase subunit NuoB [Clostridia bacterium]|nr:NADH-quinone oxidoreductase subunit NuoB [Clostridia bacterium]